MYTEPSNGSGASESSKTALAGNYGRIMFATEKHVDKDLSKDDNSQSRRGKKRTGPKAGGFVGNPNPIQRHRAMLALASASSQDKQGRLRQAAQLRGAGTMAMRWDDCGLGGGPCVGE